MRARLGPGPAVLAFDVGGTSVKAAAAGADGIVTTPVRTPSPPRSPRIVTELLDLLERTAARLEAAPVAVGLALPGIVDDDAGIGVYSENLGWRDVDFGTLASERLGLPVAIVHDVRASTLAEWRVGSATGLHDAAVVTIGTGIAAGLIVDGRVLVREGYAGEIGHSVVRPGGEPCVCGNRGCLEAVASASAIARRYTEATGRDVDGAREVAALLPGDAIAREIWHDAVDAIAYALSQLAATLAPQTIVIAGGLSEAGDLLLDPLRARLGYYARLHTPAVARAQLGGDAGVVGAALRARETRT